MKIGDIYIDEVTEKKMEVIDIQQKGLSIIIISKPYNEELE